MVGPAEEGYPENLVACDVRSGTTTPLTDGSAGWDSHPDHSEQQGTTLFLRATGPDASERARNGDDYGTIWQIPDSGEPQ